MVSLPKFEALRPRLPAVMTAVALAAVFLLAFWVRAVGLQPDKLLSFDPIFQLRFTEYFATFHTLPDWDELSYYTGRPVANYPPLIFYTTTAVWWLSQLLHLGWSLTTAAGWASAFYGAAIVIPAFFLARALSDKYGGLLAATLVGTAPQILVRTFGASFDTDQFAIFFILLTLWLGWEALRRRTPAAVATAAAGFIVFMLAWPTYWFTALMLAAVPVVWLCISLPFGKKREDGRRIDRNEFLSMLAVPAVLFVSILIAGSILQTSPLNSLAGLFGFAQAAEQWIVNISIAELQLVDLASIATWQTAFGRLVSGMALLDEAVFLLLVIFTAVGVIGTLRRDRLAGAFLATIVALNIFALTRGIRFTEFSSAMLLVAAGVGFSYIFSWSKREPFARSCVAGTGLVLAFIGVTIAMSYGPTLAADNSPNWDAAYAFLRTTPETSVVGTWWDPGHMITGLAERRVIADGAHCGNECLYTINDRITDLGKVFDTTSEQEAADILRKYKGDSDRVYWIASDDLIPKFQWLQYFGTGCDARSDSNCPLYSIFSAQSSKTVGNFSIISYGNQLMLVQPLEGSPFFVVVQGRTVAAIDELIAYVQGSTAPMSIRFDSPSDLQAAADAMNLRASNQTIPLSIWLPPSANIAVVIPQHLRESMFTKMFFLEGQGLTKFKQVFRNDQVKIYEIDF